MRKAITRVMPHRRVWPVLQVIKKIREIGAEEEIDVPVIATGSPCYYSPLYFPACVSTLCWPPVIDARSLAGAVEDDTKPRYPNTIPHPPVPGGGARWTKRRLTMIVDDCSSASSLRHSQVFTSRFFFTKLMVNAAALRSLFFPVIMIGTYFVCFYCHVFKEKTLLILITHPPTPTWVAVISFLLVFVFYSTKVLSFSFLFFYCVLLIIYILFCWFYDRRHVRLIS